MVTWNRAYGDSSGWHVVGPPGWLMSKSMVMGEPVYMLTRLGRPDRGAWSGSEIVCTGTRAGCEAAYAEATREAA